VSETTFIVFKATKSFFKVCIISCDKSGIESVSSHSVIALVIFRHFPALPYVDSTTVMFSEKSSMAS